ncbi:unnamed protein product [Ilex paraguariensis]|uniref:U3 small nucleolar RNA-associated protein 20 C-terminal domain-containing protein n=1 Tax=Ilex paraguariensis TaxID=185542 RepID=A0ABC8UBM3_9AQUA
MKKGFQRHISSVLPVMRSILESSVNVLTDRQLDLSDEAMVPSWREAYYSLVMLEKMLQQFHDLCLERDLEDIWETICELLLHPHMWLRNVSNRLVALYFATVTEACRENHEKSAGKYCLMRPSRLFLIAMSLCCQLKVQLTDDAANSLITQNLVFSICGVHSLVGQNNMDPQDFWSTVEHRDQARYLKVFHLLDSRKGRGEFASLASGFNGQNDQQNSEHYHHVLIIYLLKRMGKIALQMEAIQVKIVFDSFKSISPKILGQYEISSPNDEDGCQNYAYHMLLPLYKVSEGFAGKVIPDDVKQLAQEASETIRNTIGMQNFVQVYSQIRKNLKAKRDKRKHEEKLMAVVNPMRNAKRKLRIAAKHRANKKRKITTFRMGKWRLP